MKLIRSVALAGASLLSLSTTAFAQDAADGAEEKDPEIIVTGTLIRGKAPVGSNAILIGQEKLQETGAQSSNELLASIPQVTNYFNRVPVADLSIAVNQIQISRPNLRNISGSNASSSGTLILVDGHRIATAGVRQASVDPDLIPTGAIARVEVMTEGGSATYGADAVAGVINFITHRRFDGIKVDAHYGIAKDYWQWDAGLTAGKTWDNGSAWVSYSYTKNDALYGRDRDFIRNVDYSAQPYVGRDQNCANPNFAVNTVIDGGPVFSSVTYPRPGLVAGPANRCDLSDNSSIVPRAERHGAMAGLDWDFSDKTSLSVRGHYGQRKTQSSSVLQGSTAVNANNPYTVGNLPSGLTLGPILLFGFLPSTNVAAVNFSFEPLLGLDSQHSDTNIKQWGLNAELKHDLSADWQVRALVNWGQSDSFFRLTGISGRINGYGAPAAGATTANSFNPFNVATNNAAVIADITDSEIAGQAKDNLFNARLIAEGKLFELPGGDARLALGYEFTRDKFQQRFQSDIRIGTLGNFAYTPYSRNVHSAFGELNLPLIANSDGDAMLVVSASGRYDKYSDFGDTFNPKFGASFKPNDWLTIRGNWGTSFTAPTPLDQLGSFSGSIAAYGFVPFVKPGTTLLAGTNNTIGLQGSRPGLKPQTADTWSVGFDLAPMQGLRVSASYYDVNFSNILGTPTSNAGIFADFPSTVLYDVNGVTNAQIASFFTNGGADPLAPALQTQLTNALAGLAGGRVVEVVDFRVGNYGELHVKGIDFSMSYRKDTDWGGVDVGMNWNAQLARDQKVSPTSAISNGLLLDTSSSSLQTVFGVDIGKFRSQITWNHNSGYGITPTTSKPSQSEVGSFDVFNLFFKYDVPGEGVFKDLAFTLNVSNVFDKDPPVLLRNNPNELGFANGFTLGRMFNIGVSKKF